MDEDATEVDLGPGHIVLDGVPALRDGGTAAPPLFGPCLLWPRSPISATAELLFDSPPLALSKDGSIVFVKRPNVHLHPVCGSLGAHKSVLQTASRLVQWTETINMHHHAEFHDRSNHCEIWRLNGSI